MSHGSASTPTIPGPSRTATDAGAADKLLQQVYEQNHIDMLMQEAEQLSTINDVAAIEVKATNDPKKPIDLHVLGAEEFTVFLDPDDVRKALAVVTIDRFDATTRFRVWFDDMVTTFRTTKLEQGDTAGGTIAIQDGPPEPNTYGCIPFAFVHYGAPVRRFWTPGPGSFIRMAECRINDRLSKLDESLDKFFNPIGLFINVGSEFNPETGPGRFLRLNRKTNYTGDGFADDGDPDAKYLQAELAVEQAWQDVREFMGQIAEASDLPPSSLRLDYNDAPSGISIVIRAFPLLTRARQRRPIYQRAETDLARVICTAAGNYYGKPELAAAGEQLRMLLSWPEPRIPVPGPERDDSDGWELGQRIKSRVQVVMERYGLPTREQAIAHLKQVEDDEKEATRFYPHLKSGSRSTRRLNCNKTGTKTATKTTPAQTTKRLRPERPHAEVGK